MEKQKIKFLAVGYGGIPHTVPEHVGIFDLQAAKEVFEIACGRVVVVCFNVDTQRYAFCQCYADAIDFYQDDRGKK